jgi:hypothetical protein
MKAEYGIELDNPLESEYRNRSNLDTWLPVNQLIMKRSGLMMNVIGRTNTLDQAVVCTSLNSIDLIG